jgi:hypothetical protein
MNNKSVFQTLFDVNVNEHVERKNNLAYLSWAFAWAEVKKRFPNANYRIYENANGWNYFTDGRTCWVKTGVTIEEIEHIEYLPVMDYKNKSISAEQVTSFDVNKAIQRSLTKALARHGLGLYIYAGEDLPEIETERITPKEALVLKKVIDERNDSQKIYARLLEKYGVRNLKELNPLQYVEILNSLRDYKEVTEDGT